MSMLPDQFNALQGMRVLVIEPFTNTPHLETSMEVAERLAKNNDVIFVGPTQLNSVTDESWSAATRFLRRWSKKHSASALLSPSVRVLRDEELDVYRSRIDRNRIVSFIGKHSENLGSAQYEKFDLGMGLRSSMISIKRDTSTRLEDNFDFVKALALSSIELYELTKHLIDGVGCDLIVLFNGRFAPVRAIRRACESKETRFLVHERGSSLQKFAIYDNTIPHDASGYPSWIENWWCADPAPEENARAFFENRRRGGPTSWFSFTRKQKAGQVPERSNRPRAAFFTSSDDELAAIGDELPADTPLCDQATALRAVGLACREAGFELVVRFHPNTPKSADELVAVAHESADMVCRPDSPVDSYQLAESADVVFTHNSTIGIEAAWMGKPVFYTGRNIFEGCGAVKRIISRSEISQALSQREGKPSIDLMKYGLYLHRHGIVFELYQPRGVVSGTFRGLDLNAPFSTIRNIKVRLTRGTG